MGKGLGVSINENITCSTCKKPFYRALAKIRGGEEKKRKCST
jgi:hypothetical protein